MPNGTRRYLVAALLLHAGVASAQPAPAEVAQAVAEVFATRCGSCHGPEAKRVKGGFGFVNDLALVREMYVEKGPVEETELWKKIHDKKKPMPPPSAKTGQLTVAELATIRWWLELGEAATPQPPQGNAKPQAEKPPWIGRLHPLAVHFPIALILAAALAELGFALFGKSGLRTAARFCVTVAALSGLAAAGLGWLLAEQRDLTSTLTWHRWLGVGTAGMAVLLMLVGFGCNGGESKGRRNLWRLLLLVANGLVAVAGHLGGQLAYGPDYLPF